MPMHIYIPVVVVVIVVVVLTTAIVTIIMTVTSSIAATKCLCIIFIESYEWKSNLCKAVATMLDFECAEFFFS